jgi:DHA1 family bicyclomycin/chloramphenicol resistance-like MFS transporter
MQLSPTGLAFTLFLGTLGALPPLSIDMALPALMPITKAMETTPSMAGLTLSLFMAGFAGSPLVYGPLADRFGRRPLLLLGLALFTLGGIAATTASSITMLLGARLLQGAGAGAGMTLAFAMVQDLFEGRAAQTRLAVITVVANLAPIVAPSIGAGLLASVGWRSIYGLTALSGLLLLATAGLSIDETLPARNEAERPLPRLALGYPQVLCHGKTMTHIVVNGLGFGWMFAYVAGSPLVLIGTLHVSPAVYAVLFACTGAGIVAGAFVNGRLARRGIDSSLLLLTAILLAVIATSALVLLSVWHRLSLPVLVPLLILSTGCFGLAAPSASHGALDAMSDLAGIAGGLLTSVQMLVGAAASLLVALLLPRFGTLAMTGTMAAFAISALMVYLPHALRQSAGPRAAAGMSGKT